MIFTISPPQASGCRKWNRCTWTEFGDVAWNQVSIIKLTNIIYFYLIQFYFTESNQCFLPFFLVTIKLVRFAARNYHHKDFLNCNRNSHQLSKENIKILHRKIFYSINSLGNTNQRLNNFELFQIHFFQKFKLLKLYRPIITT